MVIETELFMFLPCTVIMDHGKNSFFSDMEKILSSFLGGNGRNKKNGIKSFPWEEMGFYRKENLSSRRN